MTMETMGRDNSSLVYFHFMLTIRKCVRSWPVYPMVYRHHERPLGSLCEKRSS
jgi:hypothetical protein